MIYSAKTTIQDDATKKNSFKEAADFIMITAPRDTIPEQPHNISGLGSKYNQNNNRRKICTGAKTGVELSFYKKDEWKKLSEEQQDECIEIRATEKRDCN